MTKHYILAINPQAAYDWNRHVLSHPITGDRPELADIIAEAVSQQAGSYLVSVKIEVEVLEKIINPAPKLQEAPDWAA
jgi:hypothetical protein